MPVDSFWFHCPSGGKRTRTEAGIFKAMGVKAGVPDIMIIYNSRVFAIELKAPGGRLGPSQKETIPLLELAGCSCAVCFDLPGVVNALNYWRIPLRGKLM